MRSVSRHRNLSLMPIFMNMCLKRELMDNLCSVPLTSFCSDYPPHGCPHSMYRYIRASNRIPAGLAIVSQYRQITLPNNFGFSISLAKIFVWIKWQSEALSTKSLLSSLFSAIQSEGFPCNTSITLLLYLHSSTTRCFFHKFLRLSLLWPLIPRGFELT